MHVVFRCVETCCGGGEWRQHNCSVAGDFRSVTACLHPLWYTPMLCGVAAAAFTARHVSGRIGVWLEASAGDKAASVLMLALIFFLNHLSGSGRVGRAATGM